MVKVLPPYFEVTLPVVVTGPGRYVTRSGEKVDIFTAGKNRYWSGAYSCNTPETWHESGLIFPKQHTQNDIMRKFDFVEQE